MTIDFLGIGAQKSGTTWLSEHLKPHPGVFIPEVKELHYWDWRQNLGLDWYRDRAGGNEARRDHTGLWHAGTRDHCPGAGGVP